MVQNLMSLRGQLIRLHLFSGSNVSHLHVGVNPFPHPNTNHPFSDVGILEFVALNAGAYFSISTLGHIKAVGHGAAGAA